MAEWKRGIHTGMDPPSERPPSSMARLSHSLLPRPIFVPCRAVTRSPLEGELESVVISQLIKIPLI